MVKDILGNEITHDMWGNRLKKENKRQPVSSSQKKEILATQKQRCAKCKKLLGVAYQFDHIKRVDKSGKSIVINLQALCSNCHDEKTHKERLQKVEKRRMSNNNNNKNYYINPITGKKEKINSGFRF